MKFRALILDVAPMREFFHVVLSLSKFSKTCVLRLNSAKMFFIVSEDDAGPRRPLVWAELPASYYFKEYNVVGVSDSQNEIFMELSTVLLARCCSILKQDAKQLKLKLTNKESPCLTLEMELVSAEGASRQCVQDIPVEIISRKHWPDYQEPVIDDFHASIQLPDIKSVKNIVEKMKTLSPTMIIEADKCGKLMFRIETTTVKLAAHFSNLNLNSFFGPNDDSLNKTVRATVDLKKFLNFLTGMQLNHCRALCNIVQGQMVNLHMEAPGALKLQIFLTEVTD